jgi:hypothetical protein
MDQLQGPVDENDAILALSKVILNTNLEIAILEWCGLGIVVPI